MSGALCSPRLRDAIHWASTFPAIERYVPCVASEQTRSYSLSAVLIRSELTSASFQQINHFDTFDIRHWLSQLILHILADRLASFNWSFEAVLRPV